MSTYDPSGPDQEGGGKPPADQQPPQPGTPPSGSPYDTPPGHPSPYGAPPGPQYGTPPGSPYGGSSYGAPPYNPPPSSNGSPYAPGPGAGPVPGMPALGTWSNRILARLLDFLLVEIVAWVILIPFVDYSTNNGWVGPIWLGYAFYLVYEGLMLSRDGQTLGKKAMKLRVAMLSDGSSPSAGAAWTRAATFVLPAVICCGGLWWPITGLFGVFDKPYRQCIHDKAAKTVVVSTV